MPSHRARRARVTIALVLTCGAAACARAAGSGVTMPGDPPRDVPVADAARDALGGGGDAPFDARAGDAVDDRAGDAGDVRAALDGADATPDVGAPDDAACAPSSDALEPASLDGAAPGDASAAPAPYCTVDHWCWYSPLPLGNALRAAWSDGPGALWAVGDRGTVVRWDGARWSTPVIAPSSPLLAVWATGPRDAWAITDVNALRGDLGVLFHWDGLAWTRVAPGVAPAGFAARDVWGSGPRDVWVVGSSGDALHWDGAAWALRTTGVDAMTPLRVVRGSGPDDVWLSPWTPTQPLRHWDGTAFNTNMALTTPADSTVTALRVGAPDDVWAATPYGVQHWDGRVWAWSSLSFSLSAFRASLWGAAANDVWLAASVADGGRSYDAAHWDGARWSATTPGTGHTTNAFAGASTNDAWAVGDLGSVAHWDGARWTAVLPVDALGDPPDNFAAVWGASASDVWAAGHRGVPPSTGELWRFDGARWRFGGVRVGHALRGVWGAAADDVWAVGDAGTILHFDGARWSAVASGAADAFGAVWGSGRDDVWIAAQSGVAGGYLLHWNGCAWSVVRPELTTWLRGPYQYTSIGGTGPNDVWTVAEVPYPIAHAVAAHWDGARWTAVDFPMGSGWRGPIPRFGIWGSRADDVWIVGGGAVNHWDGAALTARWLVSTGVYDGSAWAWGTARDDLWVATAANGLFHWDGAGWRAVDSGSALALSGIWAPDARDAWAVGAGGSILRYRP